MPEGTPRTITLDWQVLLMEAVRNIDESRGAEPDKAAGGAAEKNSGQTILVIDDSLMLLSFVKEILTEQHYHVVTAPTAEEGLRACHTSAPALILLDYVLPDMKGDEACRKLVADPTTSKIPVVYMSGFGTDLQPDQSEIPNVIGALSKPFTSASLITAVQDYLQRKVGPIEVEPAAAGKPVMESLGKKTAMEKSFAEPVLTPPVAAPATPLPKPIIAGNPPPIAKPAEKPAPAPAVAENQPALPADAGKAYFCGDSSFFSLHWALQTIAREKLTGTLRTFWPRESVELLAQVGRVTLVTTRDPNLYCEEAPVTLLNVDTGRVEAARAQQKRDGCPLFVTLAQEGLILREPGLQLVHHYGQKLFVQLWTTERVRFVFEQGDLPKYTHDLPRSEDSIDQWTLSSLRFVQYEELGKNALVDQTCVPAYTRDGYERVQHLRLTVAEAQFASQFNGSRSIAQISKNLRLDIKFARLTLFRFLALEIVECWPAQLAQKPEGRGGICGLFGR